MYVIMRGTEFVSPFGSARSYTKHLQEAMVFPDRHEALRHKCANEQVVSVQQILIPPVRRKA